MAFEKGEEIAGKYNVEEVLGGGAFAQVYRVRVVDLSVKGVRQEHCALA
jgi:hypothetical protein